MNGKIASEEAVPDQPTATPYVAPRVLEVGDAVDVFLGSDIDGWPDSCKTPSPSFSAG